MPTRQELLYLSLDFLQADPSATRKSYEEFIKSTFHVKKFKELQYGTIEEFISAHFLSFNESGGHLWIRQILSKKLNY